MTVFGQGHHHPMQVKRAGIGDVDNVQPTFAIGQIGIGPVPRHPVAMGTCLIRGEQTRTTRQTHVALRGVPDCVVLWVSR